MSASPREAGTLFRPMSDRDLALIAGIESSSYFAPWSAGTFADCLRVGYCCWVMESGQDIVGYAIMTVAVGEAHLLNICVAPAYRGLGYGRCMMDELLRIARRHKAEDMYLEVRPSNLAALSLYKQLGFRQIGMRRGYYPAPGGREDAWVLARHLGNDAVPKWENLL
ncbi:MAG: ribosomal protein S18-alanine N-acetyltransferase [Gammaproteobacteria bacterium]|nr:ribosomal protein S18-alanine N-acetyltransferase [Gammaproteobacteria bacterium]